MADDAPCLIAIMANGGRGEWPIEAKANAEFIVRAVNAHDDMLIALKDAAESLARLPDAEGAFRHECLRAAREAIARATGN